MDNSYHQTNSVTPKQLKLYEDKAVSQEDAAYEILFNNPGIFFTAEDVHKEIFSKYQGPDQKFRAPLSSIRRALSNLAHKEKYISRRVYKSDQPLETGFYNRPICGYRYLPRTRKEALNDK